jgi:hypothetical protein
MKAVKTIAIGAAGLVALVGASAPAAAQYYPGYPYGGGGNVIGQVLNSVLNPYGNQYGYGQYGYGMNQQMAVQQCTAAVQQRLSGYGGYGAYGYGNAYSNGRVLGITRVDQRSNTTLRVRGYATSGMNYGGYPYGGYGGYGGYNSPADLSFKCDVDYRGYVRDIDINRR